MTTITLNMAIHASSTIVANGYDIDEFDWHPDGRVSLSCGEDHVATVNGTQTIELDSDGCTSVQDTDDESQVELEFRVSRPLTLKDL